MSGGADECLKVLLNVDRVAGVVVESDLCAGVCFFAVGRRFTKKKKKFDI